jgi:hypothetical protein
LKIEDLRKSNILYIERIPYSILRGRYIDGETMTGKGYGRGGLGHDIVSPRILYFNPCTRNDIVRSGITVV